MGFIDDLRKGLPGLLVAVPEAWQVREDQARRAVLTDNEHKVGWHITHAPFYVDTNPAHEAQLRREVERHVRWTFAEQYGQLPLPQEALASRPPARTADPKWSPLISLSRVDLSGQPALEVVRRLAYEPAMEVVLGSLIVPVSSGTIEITAFHRNAGGARLESMDDPRHDAQFPQSPLSLVRAALRWLREDARPTVQSPLPPPVRTLSEHPGATLELESAGCAVVAPPRYLPAPQGSLQLPAGMVLLAKVSIEVADHPHLMDIWQTPQQVAGDVAGRTEALLELARRSSADWQNQGATDVEVQAEARPAAGTVARVAAQVRMKMQGAPAHTVTRWLADEDGQVYRISVGAPPFVPIEEMAAEADAVMQSWRRLRPQIRTSWLTSDERLRPPA